MKKIIVLMLISSLFLVACSNENESKTDKKIDNTQQVKETEKKDVQDSDSQEKTVNKKNQEKTVTTQSGEVVNAAMIQSNEPIKLVIGMQYVVGKDIPKGVYKATANSGHGDFIVYGQSGENKVNIILGEDNVSEQEFVAEEGDTIFTAVDTTLTPVN